MNPYPSPEEKTFFLLGEDTTTRSLQNGSFQVVDRTRAAACEMNKNEKRSCKECKNYCFSPLNMQTLCRALFLSSSSCLLKLTNDNSVENKNAFVHRGSVRGFNDKG